MVRRTPRAWAISVTVAPSFFIVRACATVVPVRTRGRPGHRPRSLAAASPILAFSQLMACWQSFSTATIARRGTPVPRSVVSISSVIDHRPAPASWILSTVTSRCVSDRASRSSDHTISRSEGSSHRELRRY